MNGVEAFTPQQVQENLGRMNGTEQYSFLDTPENREKVGKEKTDEDTKRKVEYLLQQDRIQTARNNAQDLVDKKYGEKLNSHDTLLKKVEGKGAEIITVLDGFNYNPDTGLFSPKEIKREPGARVFGGRENLVAEQQGAHLDIAVEQIN
ncbi:MAG: hypothetical protein DLD55_02865 [candidate division SR1 bacterium]|nr:MAG: hypothetical protein DLD55_02865 [candidate division SR1 bacterium]